MFGVPSDEIDICFCYCTRVVDVQDHIACSSFILELSSTFVGLLFNHHEFLDTYKNKNEDYNLCCTHGSDDQMHLCTFPCVQDVGMSINANM